MNKPFAVQFVLLPLAIAILSLGPAGAATLTSGGPFAAVPATAVGHGAPPGLFPLPAGYLTFANQVYFDPILNDVWFGHEGGNYFVHLPAPIYSWAWSSVPGTLGWTELICRLENDQIVAINPALPGFPLRGESYNDGHLPITTEPVIQSSLGGSVKSCAYARGGAGRIIIAGNDYSDVTSPVGVSFAVYPAGPVAAVPQSAPSLARLPDAKAPAIASTSLSNVQASITTYASLPGSSGWSWWLLAIGIAACGAVVAGRTPGARRA